MILSSIYLNIKKLMIKNKQFSITKQFELKLNAQRTFKNKISP